MKWVAKIGSWLVSLGMVVYLVVALAFTSDQMSDQRVASVAVDIKDLDKVDFVDPEMIISSLEARNVTLANRAIDSINKSYVREIVEDIPYVRQAEVFFTPDGIFHIKIWQRIPAMRVITGQKDYYVDEEAAYFPVSERFTSKVPVFTGEINQEVVHSQLIDMAKCLNDDEFWNAMISEVHVWSPGEIELVPNISTHRVYVGAGDDIAWKLEKLQALYEKVLPVVGWDTYRSIDLRYSNQVVCERRDTIDTK